jgi:hypothetical protein
MFPVDIREHPVLLDVLNSILEIPIPTGEVWNEEMLD